MTTYTFFEVGTDEVMEPASSPVGADFIIAEIYRSISGHQGNIGTKLFRTAEKSVKNYQYAH